MQEDQEAARRRLVEHLQEQQPSQPLPQVVKAKPNVERTQRKLDEARFFYDHLVKQTEAVQEQSIGLPILLQRLHPGCEERHLDAGKRGTGEVEGVGASVESYAEQRGTEAIGPHE
jgi:hypothetical protein